MTPVRLRVLNVGCFGGGTGLPSLLGGLKTNPWVTLHAVVTMFDSGGSSGQLRDELGVLPPGDVLKCALALARNEREARAILLTRLPMLEKNGRLAGHIGLLPLAATSCSVSVGSGVGTSSTIILSRALVRRLVQSFQLA